MSQEWHFFEASKVLRVLYKALVTVPLVYFTYGWSFIHIKKVFFLFW